MSGQPKSEAPITRGNALYLAERLGAEHVSDNRTVFNMISSKLFGAYSQSIGLPINNNWRRLPTVLDLIAAAEAGFKANSESDDETRIERLQIYIAQKAADIFTSSVPQLIDVAGGTDATTLHRIVTELMEQRHRIVTLAKNQNQGFVSSFFAGQRAETIHGAYLNRIPKNDLVAAYAKVADIIANEALAFSEGGERQSKIIDDASRLVMSAKAIGGIEDHEVLKSLKRAEDIIEQVSNSVAVPAM